MTKFAVILSLATVALRCATAQTPNSDSQDLSRTISALDTRLFDAYNRCDLDGFGSLLAEDIEFYHDQSGLEVGRQKIVESIKTNICGKVHRELVARTLEVYPLKGFGAVEIGVHRFTHPGRNDTEPVGEARFIHIWRDTNGRWTLARVISFDHHTTMADRSGK